MATEELIEKQKLIREGLVRFCECEHMGDSEECPNCEFGLAFVDRILAFLRDNARNIAAERLVDVYGLDPFQAMEYAGVMCDAIFGTAPLMEKK